MYEVKISRVKPHNEHEPHNEQIHAMSARCGQNHRVTTKVVTLWFSLHRGDPHNESVCAQPMALPRALHVFPRQLSQTLLWTFWGQFYALEPFWGSTWRWWPVHNSFEVNLDKPVTGCWLPDWVTGERGRRVRPHGSYPVWVSCNTWQT